MDWFADSTYLVSVPVGQTATIPVPGTALDQMIYLGGETDSGGTGYVAKNNPAGPYDYLGVIGTQYFTPNGQSGYGAATPPVLLPIGTREIFVTVTQASCNVLLFFSLKSAVR
jgi:hypothetical protein